MSERSLVSDNIDLILNALGRCLVSPFADGAYFVTTLGEFVRPGIFTLFRSIARTYDCLVSPQLSRFHYPWRAFEPIRKASDTFLAWQWLLRQNLLAYAGTATA
jgi:hypothetical protein